MEGCPLIPHCKLREPNLLIKLPVTFWDQDGLMGRDWNRVNNHGFFCQLHAGQLRGRKKSIPHSNKRIISHMFPNKSLSFKAHVLFFLRVLLMKYFQYNLNSELDFLAWEVYMLFIKIKEYEKKHQHRLKLYKR